MNDEFGLPERTLACIRAIFAANPRVEKVVLYGSRAKGNYKPGSDIDLTLQGEDLGHRDLLDLRESLYESPIPYTVDLSIFAQIDNPNLIEHIERVGKVFYQREAPTI